MTYYELFINKTVVKATVLFMNFFGQLTIDKKTDLWYHIALLRIVIKNIFFSEKVERG